MGSSVITYIRLVSGFVYLVAIMDWFSRYVLAWKLSSGLEADFCVEALETALQRGKPDIFNSDQGSQFTSQAFTGVLEQAGVASSMDGRGRVFDNIFIERLWWSVKYNCVYVHDWHQVGQAESGLGEYFTFYNSVRPHDALDNSTPYEVYCNG